MSLRSTQPLTEMSKAAGAWGLQTYHFHVPIVSKCGSLNLLEPSGSVQACNGIASPLHFYTKLYTDTFYCAEFIKCPNTINPLAPDFFLSFSTPCV
jgi:hypothetical protein